MIHIELYCKENTDNLMKLLLMADPDEETIKKYIATSTIFIANDTSELVGVVVITSTQGQYELKNLAVLESHQGKGIAKKLIFKAKNYAKENRANCLVVGTGNSSLSQLALYQKCGFRMQSIEKNYFAKYPEPIVENGINCLDMVVLSAKL